MAGVAAPTGNNNGPSKGGARLPGTATPGRTSAPRPNSGTNSSGAPVPILTQSQIANQAKGLVNQAYGPAVASLNSEATRISGLADKRQADANYYEHWVSQQNEKLTSQMQANNQHLQGLEQNLIGAQNGLYSQQAGGMVAAADARPGNVSNNAQSNDFGTAPSNGQMTQLQQSQATNESLLTGTESWSNALMQSMNAALTGAVANSQNYITAENAKDQLASTDALNKVHTEIANLGGREAGSLATVTKDLTAQNTKAKEFNSLYGLTAAKTGATLANTQSEIANRAANTQSLVASRAATAQHQLFQEKLDSSKFNEKQWLDQQKLAISQGQLQLSKERVSIQERKLLQASVNGRKPQPPALQEKLYSQISSESGAIKAAIDAGLSPQDALHHIVTGEPYTYNQSVQSSSTTNALGQTSHTYKPVVIHPKATGQDSLTAIAYALATQGGLTSQQVKSLNNLGLQNVLAHYSLYTPPTAQPEPAGVSSAGHQPR